MEIENLKNKNVALEAEVNSLKESDSKQQEDIAKLKKQVSDLHVKVTNKSSSGDDPASMDQFFKEINLRKSKESNLIINGFSELDSTASKEDSEQADSAFVDDLLSLLEVEPREQTIKSTSRLGPRKEGEHVRPLLLPREIKHLLQLLNWQKMKIGRKLGSVLI